MDPRPSSSMQRRFRLRQGCGGRAGQALRRRSGQALRHRSGQAMAEFLVGLVCIMFLIVGLQQIDLLSRAGFDAMGNARHSMALQYTKPVSDQYLKFNFGAPTDVGADKKDYTADDRPVYGNDRFYQKRGYLESVFNDDVTDYFDSCGLDNPHFDLKYSEMSTSSPALEMQHAADQETVKVMPFLRQLLGDDIQIGRDLWMPRWDRVLE